MFVLQLSKGDKAADVESALAKSGHTSLQPVFEEMADGKCFTLDKDTDEKESRLWIDDVDHAQLLRQCSSSHAIQLKQLLLGPMHPVMHCAVVAGSPGRTPWSGHSPPQHHSQTPYRSLLSSQI